MFRAAKTHASGAKYRLSVLYQSEYFQQQNCALCKSVGVYVNVCVAVWVIICVCVCCHCERMWVSFGLRVIGEFGPSPPISLSVVCIMLCYALHDIAVLICTLMSIY